jgi:hypothetical protein
MVPLSMSISMSMIMIKRRIEPAPIFCSLRALCGERECGAARGATLYRFPVRQGWRSKLSA